MSTQNRDSAPADRTSVNIERHAELLWWSAELRVTPEQLREAVAQVGSHPDDVRRRLQEAAKASFKNMGED